MQSVALQRAGHNREGVGKHIWDQYEDDLLTMSTGCKQIRHLMGESQLPVPRQVQETGWPPLRDVLTDEWEQC